MIELISVMGDDLTIVNSARVSFNRMSDYDKVMDGNRELQVLNNRDYKLIRYLLKHNHYTPFTHPQMTLRVKMPIFIARQWFKHQIGLSRNEVSRRYVSDSPEFYMPKVLRMSAENRKQGSSDDITPQSDQLLDVMHNANAHALAAYENMLACNVCPEQARMVLPQSMMTEFYETGSLQAYLRIVGLRNSPDAQAEIREYAILVDKIIRELFPYTHEAMEELGYVHK